MVVAWSMEVSRKKTTASFKALDGTILTVNRETGERVTLSHTCMDLDNSIPTYLGVSKCEFSFVCLVMISNRLTSCSSALILLTHLTWTWCVSYPIKPIMKTCHPSHPWARHVLSSGGLVLAITGGGRAKKAFRWYLWQYPKCQGTQGNQGRKEELHIDCKGFEGQAWGVEESQICGHWFLWGAWNLYGYNLWIGGKIMIREVWGVCKQTSPVWCVTFLMNFYTSLIII